jgi:signal transduction histidine kinase
VFQLAALSTSLASTDPIAQLLKRQHTPLVIEHVSESPLLSPDVQAWMSKTGVQTVLIIPLFSEKALFGAISVYSRKPRSYQPEELNLAQALAHQALLALRITRLAEQEQRATILSERTRVARDIHDTLSQGFTGIVLQLEAAEDVLDEAPHERDTLRSHLSRARTLARESLAEARRSVWELRHCCEHL